MIYIDKISYELVDRVIDVLDSDLPLDPENTHTVDGIQTKNIREYFDDFLLSEILPNDYAYRTKWIHAIEYKPGGFQRKHKHSNERYSWILYLEDSDGDTLFEIENGIKVKPEKGKLVIFSANIYHEGLPCTIKKRVLVGAIDKVGLSITTKNMFL